MTGFLLDTNVPSELTRPQSDPQVEKWLDDAGECQFKGRGLTMADGLIAATALEHGLTLVTRNVKDFDLLGVTILNPWD